MFSRPPLTLPADRPYLDLTQMRFSVIDLTTGKEPDLETIALKEDWATGLIYCDMEGFALAFDGMLVLMDECGNYRYCPRGRFQVAIATDAS